MQQYFYCDICQNETEHELIKEKTHLYRCKDCGTFSTHLPEKEIEVRAIISSEDESEKGKLFLKESEIVEKGDEMIVDVSNGFRIGEVTSLELKNGKRTEISDAKSIATVWLRDTGEVAVKISLHRRSVTSPMTIHTSGETEFKIGDELEIGNKKYRITKIKSRDGKVIDRIDDTVKAKNIKRVYAKLESKIKRSKGRRR
jgi:uncharacterized Zn finger protein